MLSYKLSSYHHLQAYFGDIHNHCDLSYGHGSAEDAFHNAQLQLDFASVTLHAHWPDLPTDDPQLGYLVRYHEEGFKKALANWSHYKEIIERFQQDGSFVTFPSFEWHSMGYGDHCIYFKDNAPSEIITAPDLPGMRQALRELNLPALMIPHHIGYKSGYRGINWSAFTEEFSPVVEVFSFHGLSESTTGPYPYLHSMGPRHEHSSAQYGWSQGHIFGIVGSTDHHNAHPGAYGFGRMGVWAEELSREGIWTAIQKRHTYALTGDRIQLAFSLNGALMGDICPPAEERALEVSVEGGDSIDYIEVLRNNRVIHRENVFEQFSPDERYKVYIELGWGETKSEMVWDVQLEIRDGELLDIEPRFRGHVPNADAADVAYAYSQITRPANNHIHLNTRTHPNQSLFMPSTEGVSLQIKGHKDTQIIARIGDQQLNLSLNDLLTGTRTFYCGGFVSPAICFHRAIPQAEFSSQFALSERRQSPQRDWYYVRVRQRNNQWAWSSPIWVEPTQV